MDMCGNDRAAQASYKPCGFACKQRPSLRKSRQAANTAQECKIVIPGGTRIVMKMRCESCQAATVHGIVTSENISSGQRS
ncbi:hypothetical protein AV530_007442 [Patagioenas fasciata monilis]|uniref:Uncharacterized protein n=1 Tax=Patagioenas fasciata monilis TaxID=372326 RepID=A0A1V4JXR5_PATFA|nr:hypothetical protein AV530_007442 [Patagioenas fasciata monilis]